MCCKHMGHLRKRWVRKVGTGGNLCAYGVFRIGLGAGGDEDMGCFAGASSICVDISAQTGRASIDDVRDAFRRRREGFWEAAGRQKEPPPQGPSKILEGVKNGRVDNFIGV